jgi:hypothetical protein
LIPRLLAKGRKPEARLVIHSVCIDKLGKLMIQRNERIPDMNTPTGEMKNQVNGSGAVKPLGSSLQELNERVIRDAQDLAARIRQEAEIEASRLLENVRLQAGEIIKSTAGRGGIIEREERSSGQTEDSAGKLFFEVVVKIRHELSPYGDISAFKASFPEDETPPAPNKRGPDAAVADQVLFPAHGPDKSGGELHSELSRSLKPLDAAELDNAAPRQNLSTEVAPEEKLTLQPKPSTEKAELFFGEVNINVAPPVNVVRFLAILRSLENTRGIRTLGTSGSRNSGSVINISLDSPLHLLHFLRELPGVEEAKAQESQVLISTEQTHTKGIQVTLKNSGEG